MAVDIYNFFAGWIALSTGKNHYPMEMCWRNKQTIHWIAIYSVDSDIYALKPWSTELK